MCVFPVDFEFKAVGRRCPGNDAFRVGGIQCKTVLSGDET